MKHQRIPRKELKVTVTFSETDKPSSYRHHGELPSADVVDRRSKRDHLNFTELFDTLRFPTGLQQEIGADWDPG
jgi:hypothetical protein